ncbi:PLP-dependent transferase [Micromonospora purpureochromogenes]|uniref:PLP-dependent transferase n=1 Tax=Micromonospora purpureochromogenes TaxID=47872 RepID=UPI0027B940C7|nr:PLP-dependent transferase [Micromonospora purpureochromogenes]
MSASTRGTATRTTGRWPPWSPSWRARRRGWSPLPALAQAIQEHPAVARVRYPGLPSHPQHALARRQMTGFGGVLSVEVKAGRAGAAALLAGLGLAKRAASLGSVSTLVVHPRSMWAGIVDADQLAASGISDGLVRVSTGIEDTADLVDDFLAALDKTADPGQPDGGPRRGA